MGEGRSHGLTAPHALCATEALKSPSATRVALLARAWPTVSAFLPRCPFLRELSTMPHHEPKLPVQKPVPEDIVIAQSVEPVHISKIAEEVGLLPEEVDLYGRHKAKVCCWGPRLILPQICALQKSITMLMKLMGMFVRVMARSAASSADSPTSQTPRTDGFDGLEAAPLLPSHCCRSNSPCATA